MAVNSQLSAQPRVLAPFRTVRDEWVGPRGTGANLRICRKKSQIRGRACPSVGRGGADRADCVRDLELRELEVSKQTAWQSVLPLALRTRRTVDADSERR